MNRKAFTLIELVVAIAILGVLMIIAIPSVKYLQDFNRNKKYEAYEKSLTGSSKLYVDGYNEDLFGIDNTGCAIIKYSDLKSRDLVEDIQIKDTTCDTSSTCIKVRKSKNGNYHYETNMVCKENGKNIFEDINSSCSATSCSLEDGVGPQYSVILNPTKSTYYLGDNPKASIKIWDNGVGLKANQVVYYQWFKNETALTTKKELEFKNKYYVGSITSSIDVPNLENIDEPTNYSLKVTGNLYDVDNNKTSVNDSKSIKYFVGALLIRMKAGEATMKNPHHADYKIDSSDYIYHGTNDRIISKIKYKGSADLWNYNNPDWINLEKAHYHIDSKIEWKYNGKEYDQSKDYKVSDFGYQDSDLITENKTVDVTANWKINYYTLTYDNDGGTGCTSQTAAYNSTWGTLCTPTKSGNEFLGWYNGSTEVNKNTVVTGDIKVKAKWKVVDCTITYLRNTSSTDTTKMTKTFKPGSNYRIEENTWNNSGKEFIGWATVANANASSTWYDEDYLFKPTENLTLYAQWYDVLSLEKAYSTFVKTDSFYFHDDKLFTFTRPSVGSSKTYSYSPPSPPPTKIGFRVLSVSSYGTSDYDRIYGVTYNKFKLRALENNNTNAWWAQDTLYIRDNTAKTNEDDYLEWRISDLFDEKNRSLKLDDIATESFTKDNISMASYTLGGFVYKDASNGYFYIGPAGYNIANASSSGKLTSRCYLTTDTAYSCSSSAYSGSCTARHVLFNYSKSVKDITPKIKITGYMIRIKNSTGTSSYNQNSHSTLGASRYAALSTLNTAKSNYIPRSYVKRSAIIQGSAVSPGAWNDGTVSKSISIPDGKILGVAEHGVSNGSGGSGESYSVINKAYISGVNTKSGTFHMTFYGGNKKYTSSTGNAMTKVYGWGYAIYISSGTMTIK